MGSASINFNHDIPDLHVDLIEGLGGEDSFLSVWTGTIGVYLSLAQAREIGKVVACHDQSVEHEGECSLSRPGFTVVWAVVR